MATSDREALDRERRNLALALAVESVSSGARPASVLSRATQFLGWLRQPTSAATMNLRVSEPVSK